MLLCSSLKTYCERQGAKKNIPEGQVPPICILDPDGDIVSNVIATRKAKVNLFWACYHSKLYNFEYSGVEFGIVGCAVGASFAVLIAEELFASGCQLLISVTSSGLILKKVKRMAVEMPWN